MSKNKMHKASVARCMEWLQKQDSQDPKKPLQNQNDIQFIIQTNAERKKFLISAAEDEASVPPGVDEQAVEPKKVPIYLLRTAGLHFECEWQTCRWHSNDHGAFQKHVRDHLSNLQIIGKGNEEYGCLWNVCGHRTNDYNEMIRHFNYHVYHSRLLAIGFNARATLKLVRCKRDSTKRNVLPLLKSDYCCMWTECKYKFNDIQMFFDHVKMHTLYAKQDNKYLCSWAGCGATFHRRVLLVMHTRSHTSEKLIACYHCGLHFTCNRKLSDHLKRQNPSSQHTCSVCGVSCASEYLLREHARQHVCMYACSMCAMTAPSLAALAVHVRYRHLDRETARTHSCPQCTYKAVTKADLGNHLNVHNGKRKAKKKKKIKKDEEASSDKDESDDNSSSEYVPSKRKRPKVVKKYACHMCPEKKSKIFSKGGLLTSHLVKVHGIQWPEGHVRFRYQVSEDGLYRLTTTRYEILEVSKMVVDGYNSAQPNTNTNYEFDVVQKADATNSKPTKFEIVLKSNPDTLKTQKSTTSPQNNSIEITMCDVDEHGNIISSETISDVVYS